MSADLARKLDDLQPFEHYPYASFVKNRTGGDFKRHKTLGYARNAVRSTMAGTQGQILHSALYRWDDETKGWVPIK
jgi:hypothetical protein